MNILILSGRLVRDPGISYTKSGKVVASITLAVDDGYGENKTTDFFDCVAWEKTAETIGNTLSKGRKITVSGKLKQRRYEKDGQKRQKLECLIRSFEYGDSKNHEGKEFGDGVSIEDFGKDIFPDEEIPF